jgi:hypothetical protein
VYFDSIFFYVQIRKEALWAGFAMKPDHEAMITVCLLAEHILISIIITFLVGRDS